MLFPINFESCLTNLSNFSSFRKNIHDPSALFAKQWITKVLINSSTLLFCLLSDFDLVPETHLDGMNKHKQNKNEISGLRNKGDLPQGM